MPLNISSNKNKSTKENTCIVKSTSEIYSQIKLYLEQCKSTGYAPTDSGFARYLGYKVSTQMFDLKKRGDSWATAVTSAMEQIEDYHIQNLTNPNTKNGNGILKYLVNKRGYVEKQTIDLNTNITHRVVVLPEKKAVGSPILAKNSECSTKGKNNKVPPVVSD